MFFSLGGDFLIGVIQLMFVGHLGSTEMAAAALGSSYSKVTGQSVILGLLSAMDTLVSQCYGAKKYKQIGDATNLSIVVVIVTSLLILPLCLFSGPILSLLGQDEEVVELAALFIRISWFQLIPYGILGVLRKYLQNQNIVTPMIWTGVLSVVVSTISIAVMLLVLDWGFAAVPLNLVFTNILSCILLIAYIIFYKLWKVTYSPFTLNTLHGMGTYMKLAIPGMFMMCAEWWTYEIHILVSGTIGIASLASMSLLFTALSLFYTFPLCYSITVSIIVGNAIGEGNTKKATSYSRLVFIMAVSTQAFCAFWFYILRNQWPLLFTTDQEILDITQNVILIVCLFTTIDAAQNCIGGILRGAGKQAIGAATYLVIFYIVGLPLGISLALLVPMGTKGQWTGMLVSSTLNAIILAVYYLCILNWNTILQKAQQRMVEKELAEELRDNSDSNLSEIEHEEQELV